MTQIQDKLAQDMKDAMRAKDKDRLGTIRMLRSSLKNKRIELGQDLSDEDVISVLATEAKKRREAAQAFEEGGRQEMADKEQVELGIIEDYLPKQLTDEEAAAIVEEVIASTGAESKKDMGRVMGAVMPRFKGVYDGSKVKDIVLSKLA